MALDKSDVISAACIQAAATLWAAGKLTHLYSGVESHDEDFAGAIIDFARKLHGSYRTKGGFPLEAGPR
jgi:hypothetical protein